MARRHAEMTTMDDSLAQLAAVAPVTIVPMSFDHLPDVLAIERAAAPHPWTIGIFTEELALTDSRTYLVACRGGVVVGFGGVLVQVSEAHITNIAVANAHRRSGIARALMVRLMTSAIRGNAAAATLEVRVSNVGAQRLYHRFGFVPAGVRPSYYPDGEDAVIMWADDIASEGYNFRLNSLAAPHTRNQQ